MNKRLIIKFILFAITLLPSLKSGAQNVFFGDTLRFDSIVTYKLLYGKNPTEYNFYHSTFRDTTFLTDKDKKRLELFFNPNRSLGFLGAVWQREIL